MLSFEQLNWLIKNYCIVFYKISVKYNDSIGILQRLSHQCWLITLKCKSIFFTEVKFKIVSTGEKIYLHPKEVHYSQISHYECHNEIVNKYAIKSNY